MNTLSDSPAPLMQRLVRECHAQWLDPSSIKDWTAAGGDRVLLLAGDPVRFPEGQDVAAVLPELYKSLPGRFSVGIVAREHEDEIAQRYGSQRWPTLLFFRDGGYVSALAGMHDWDVFLHKVVDCLQMPVVRAPTIGIPVVSAPSGSGCQA